MWPDVERRLRALLYRRGLDHSSAEDVVQEVALRALAGRVTFTSAKDLLRWAGPVACNLHVDLLRQRARVYDGDVDPDRPSPLDVAGEVADRLELQRALRGIARLRPADQAAIIEAVNGDPVPRTRKEAVRLAVRRHRARSRLALLMEHIAAWVVGWRWLRQPRTAAATAALVPVALVFPMVAGPQRVPEPPGSRPPAVTVPAAEPVTRGTPVRHVLAADPRPRSGPERAVAPTAPERRAPAAAKRERPARNVDVKGPGGIEVDAGPDDRRPEDGIVCVIDLLELPDVCV